jgi:hypothetical protein
MVDVPTPEAWSSVAKVRRKACSVSGWPLYWLGMPASRAISPRMLCGTYAPRLALRVRTHVVIGFRGTTHPGFPTLIELRLHAYECQLVERDHPVGRVRLERVVFGVPAVLGLVRKPNVDSVAGDLVLQVDALPAKAVQLSVTRTTEDSKRVLHSAPAGTDVALAREERTDVSRRNVRLVLPPLRLRRGKLFVGDFVVKRVREKLRAGPHERGVAMDEVENSVTRRELTLVSGENHEARARLRGASP